MKTNAGNLVVGIILAVGLNTFSQSIEPPPGTTGLVRGTLGVATQRAIANKAELAHASNDGVWRRTGQVPSAIVPIQSRLQIGKSVAFTLNSGALRSKLASTPREFTEQAGHTITVLHLPMPDGSFTRFRVVESPIMEPELATKFPELKTYSGRGLDDPTATARMDLTPDGFRAQVRSKDGLMFVEPSGKDAPDVHVSFHARDVDASGRRFNCRTESEAIPQPHQPAAAPAAAPGFAPAAIPPSVGRELRVYRLAVASDAEFTALNGGTLTGAMASILSIINRVNGLYEAELAVRLVLVAHNDLLVYFDAATDPFPSVDPCALKEFNQAVLDSVIGSASYDLGHVLSGRTAGGCSGGSGGIVCESGVKAKATSGSQYPNEPLWALVGVAHEMGHQLGANHTWNGAGGYCTAEQYVGLAAYEPGSGSTIMSYAGLCGVVNTFQFIGAPYFHSGSFDQINSYVNGAGATCRTLQSTTNTPPGVSAGPNYVIPARTPFTLTAIGSDADGDTVTYCWEQRDLGPRQPASGPGSEDNGLSPLFRSFPPTTNASRTFPQLADILNDRSTVGERLPSRTRTLHFRITARDLRTGISGGNMQVSVISNAGPFRLLSPGPSVAWSGTQTVVWDVAGATNPPINATNVNIMLSTNGGYDFPISLATGSPNDGSETVTLPDVYAPEARIKIEAAGNIFFDISRTNFTIVPAHPVIRPVAVTLLGEECPTTNRVIDPGETVTVQFAFENIGTSSATNLVVSLLATSGVLAPSEWTQ